MPLRTLALLLSLLALPAFAQTGDLSVRFNGESRISGPFYVWSVTLAWTGTQTARDIVLDLDVQGTILNVVAHGVRMECTQTDTVRCTMPLLLADDEYSGAAVEVRLEQPGIYLATATVSTRTPEERTDNNTATHTVVQAGLPELYGSLLWEDDTIDPKHEGTLRLGIQNNAEPATNVVVRARIEDGGGILEAVPTRTGFGRPTAQCTIESGEVTCRIPTLGRHGFELVRLRYRAPNHHDGRKAVASGTVESDQEDFNPSNNAFRTEVTMRRLFLVNSAEDEGSGTLRQAILDAKGQCEAVPCTIGFEGVSVIQPRTPLPHVSEAMRINGGTVRVALDGSLLAAGEGLFYDGGCQFDVRNLEIRNFPGHGIEARQNLSPFQPCWHVGGSGLYVRKTTLSNNERGVVAKGLDVSLRENVIVDHRRAGVFIDDVYYSEIYNNVIVNNGASGIFINTSDQPQFGGIPPGADIVENIVHGNGEWGIARTRNSGIVQMRRNSMARNGLYGYDVGLDLGTPNREREKDEPRAIPNKPVLESATYDPATDTTMIRGRAFGFGWLADFYASSSLSRYGYPEGERWLGTTNPKGGGLIELRVPGDLRGQWITATMSTGYTLYFLRDDAKPQTDVYRPSGGQDTSELSDAIQVQ